MPVSVHNHWCVNASKPVAVPVSNCTILQVAVLKQAMMMKRDKLRGECENSQVTEQLAVCTEEVEQLKEQLQSGDKEWQVGLRAETDRWQERLEEQQQDVETEQAKMAEAVAGIMCCCFWEREIKQ
jgi:regulator of replication initiation timing